MDTSRLLELHLSEICLSLQSKEKIKRQQALEKLDNIVTNNKNNWNECELSEIWKIVSKYITKHVTDESELCRNLSIDITKKFLKVLPIDEKNLIYLVPVLKRRFGSQEIHEASEEVRLNCVTLIKLIIHIYKKFLPIYLNDFITILSRTVIDNYPKIKKESCESISKLAENVPLKFYDKSNDVIKPILTNFTHQHYRVRIASINAIGQVMLYGNSKNMNEISTPMAERLFDQSGAVRLAVIQVAGMWLIKLRDRYSWWYKLIPLILTGFHDEISEIREKAEKLWSAAGQLYLEENDNDDRIKNKSDFLTEDPKHYPSSIKRPNLGCRVIIQRNIGHLVSGIAKDLNDWLSDIRVRSAQLLAVLVLNAEEDITQHIHKLLPAMYRACSDEDKRVIVNVVIAAEYIGHFVPPETYCQLVLPTFDEGNISSGHLIVFSAIIRGSKKEHLTNKLNDIGRFLQVHNVCRSKNSIYQQELLKSCDAILSVCQENSSVIAEELFEIIFTVWSMAQQQKIEIYSKKLLNDLTLMTNNKNIEDLLENHIHLILNMLKNSSTTWTIFSPEFFIFSNCLKNAKITTHKNIDLVMSILKITMDKNSLDFELRLKMLILLSEYFQQRSKKLNDIAKFDSFIGDFLDNILIPSLIWKAGRSAESVRTSAMSCLCALLDNDDSKNDNHPIFSNVDKFVECFKKLKPIVMSLIYDNSKQTRLFSLKSIYVLLKNAKKLKCISDEDVIEIYPGIIKRLDDGCDDVRLVAIEALIFVFQSLSCDYDLYLGRSHIDYLYTSTIIHLDDPEEKFQTVMLDAIIQLAKVHPKMLYDKIEKSKINFRNQQALERIQKECQEVLCFEK